MSLQTSAQTYLSERGYAIDIQGNETLVEQLKKMCTVSPFSPMVQNPEPFHIYKLSSKKLYIPKTLGLEHLGLPTIDKLHNGDDSDRLVFQGVLRPEQEVVVADYIKAAADPMRGGGIISLSCGQGKCLGEDTLVMMSNGDLKKVQDIKKGDQLMGDDSTPRRVISVCAGVETLYRVVLSNGDMFTCNRSHILCLRHWGHDGVIEISVDEFLGLYDDVRNSLDGYKVPVDFPEVRCMYDPYYIGSHIIKDVCTCVPIPYKYNSVRVRQQFLAGFLDTNAYILDGRYKRDHMPHVLAADIAFIARSLGLDTSIGLDNTVSIWGNVDQLPTKNYYLCPIKPTSDLLYRVTILPTGIGRYYGFELDGNGRFLLGDFTVTHNTTIALYIAAQLKKKMLVVCHKEFLLNQWRERINQFLPGAKVGLIKAKTLDIDDKDIVLASLQSLAMKDYDPEVFQRFGIVTVDECHRTAAEVFSKALSKITSRYTIGLSATLDRKDGLRKVFEWYLGRPVNNMRIKTERTMLVEIVPYIDRDNNKYREELTMSNGKLNIAAMVNNLCAHAPRNVVIVDKLVERMTLDKGRRTLILSDRRNHLKELEVMIKRRDCHYIGTIGFYIGGMKEKELAKSAECDVILGTNALASEGMDIPGLNTLIIASPISTIEQQLGRIQRQTAHEQLFVPYTIDISDTFSVFKSQAKRRMAHYKKKRYTIVEAPDAQLNLSEEDYDTSTACFVDE